MTWLSCALACLLPSGSYGKRVENGVAGANDGSARACVCVFVCVHPSEKDRVRKSKHAYLN